MIVVAAVLVGIDTYLGFASEHDDHVESVNRCDPEQHGRISRRDLGTSAAKYVSMVVYPSAEALGAVRSRSSASSAAALRWIIS